MTAPPCKDCAHVMNIAKVPGEEAFMVTADWCSILGPDGPNCLEYREEGALCGPDAKLFTKREGA